MSNKAYYQRMKRRARNTAVWFSNNAEEILAKHPIPLSDWMAHFHKIGKRYGLMREFAKIGVI